MSWRWLALAGILAASCACVRYQAQPLDPIENIERVRARSLEAESLRAFLADAGIAVEDWPRRQWDLTTLTLVGLHNHPEVRIARAQWSVRQAEQGVAARVPPLSFAVPLEYHSDRDAGESGHWSAGAGIGWTIEAPGKRAARRAIAAARTEAAALQLRQQVWQLRAQVRNALSHVARARAVAMHLQAVVAATASGVEVLAERAAQGEASAFEIGIQRLQLQSVTLQAQTAAGAAALAEVQLAQALGLMPEALDGVELVFEPEPAPLTDAELAQLQAQALTERHDVGAALARYAEADARLRYEVARQWPDLELSPGFLFDQGDHVWQLATGLTAPLGGPQRAAIKAAAAARDLAAARFEALQFEVVSALRAALARLRAVREELAAAQALLASARSQETVIERRRASGDADRFETLGGEVERLSAAAAVLRARYDLLDAVGALEDALQRPLLTSPFVTPRWPQETPLP